jgi:hypothetical protein
MIHRFHHFHCLSTPWPKQINNESYNLRQHRCRLKHTWRDESMLVGRVNTSIQMVYHGVLISGTVTKGVVQHPPNAPKQFLIRLMISYTVPIDSTQPQQCLHRIGTISLYRTLHGTKYDYILLKRCVDSRCWAPIRILHS